jgi:hypothetical protein
MLTVRICFVFLVVVSTWSIRAGSIKTVPIAIERLDSIDGMDDWDWTHARTAYVGAGMEQWVTTMSQTTKRGSHGYHDIFESVSSDRGKTWSSPSRISSLKRQTTKDGYDVAPGDLWPSWHPATGTILVTGKSFNFAHTTGEDFLREKVLYAVKSLETSKWGPMRFVSMPGRDQAGYPLLAPNAGCNQPLVTSNGDLLLPIRYQRSREERIYTSIVARCRFDGETLSYVEHGSEHSIARDRGLYEPSLTEYRGRYFLTLRADHSAFVTRGLDGTNFEPVREWRFDDGAVLGSYNTQQHWVTIGDGLFLVYTRKGANNDHIFRHRAPLFIAQVDPERLVVIRKTEKVLLEENEACLGNSGICRVNDQESWVTCGEVRVSEGKRKGENNRILFSRILAE